MTASPEVLALIPARSGSKSIPHKNIRLLLGKPLLAYSIEHARASKLINRVIVSTDSAEYAQIARQYGAETPFLRPAEISQDHSTDLDVFLHALDWLATHEGYAPDLCVHLRPTYPVRRVADIDAMIQILIDHPELDAARSVALAPETPYKMWFRDADGLLSPVVQTEIPEAHNAPRQSLPTVYLQNACIDVVRSRIITAKHSMTGSRIWGYVMQDNFDIDTEAQLQQALAHIAQSEVPSHRPPGSKIFCFDIDGVIANLVPDNDYRQAAPRSSGVEAVNFLFEQGHRIILFTARGSVTGIDWREVTREQMQTWGVKYHELLFGKPAADYYVDDKAATLDDLNRLVSQWRGKKN